MNNGSTKGATVASVLYVEDEVRLASLVGRYLARAGHDVRLLSTGEELIESIGTVPCDLVLLDLGLPGMDGLTVIGRVRERSSVPLVVLTARSADLDCTQAIAAGADLFLSKPFRPMVLVSHVDALLRRAAQGPATASLSYGDLRVDPVTGDFLCRGVRLLLAPRERRLLLVLMSNDGSAKTREHLASAVWGSRAGSSHAMDESVRRLRRALEDAGSAVQVCTLWGRGFCLEGSDERDAQ